MDPERGGDMRIRPFLGIALILLVVCGLSTGLTGPTVSAQGSPVTRRAAATETPTSTDVLVINDPHKYAFFGWFKASQMAPAGWALLNRTLLWATGFRFPNETRIVFFSNMTPSDDSTVVWGWLISHGYDAPLIDIRAHSDSESLPSDYYSDFDLVIYWNTTDYDSANVVASGVPFITVAAAQTDEMGIGSGLPTLQAANDTFYVVNNNYYPTHDEPLGALLFGSSMEFIATEAVSGGKRLVQAQQTAVGARADLTRTQDTTVWPNGSATMLLTITVPDSPFAEIYRQSFFSNAAALEPGMEYNIPETKTLEVSTELEDEIQDMTLPGDVTGDGATNIFDIVTAAGHYGASLGDGRWDFDADVLLDGKIDIFDIVKMAGHYGKNLQNTGQLNVACYYNGSGVKCTDVYHVGPLGMSTPINVSGCHTWAGLWPGQYTVYGTNVTQASTTVNVAAGETSYAQLDFGGTERPPLQQPMIPIRDEFHLQLVLEQLVLLGFPVEVTTSKVVPWGPENATVISATLFAPMLAEFISFWRINVGPQDENATDAAADFMSTNIHYIQNMLQMLPGEQVYESSWQLELELPSTASIINGGELTGLTWTVDFGGGTIMTANVSMDTTFPRVFLSESTTVTEWNITATEEALGEAFAVYRTFHVDYALSGLTTQAAWEPQASVQNLTVDWSKTWSWPISLGPWRKEWHKGPCTAAIRVHPQLLIEAKLGWRFKWQWWPPSLKFKKFVTWIAVTPSIESNGYATVSESFDDFLGPHTLATTRIAKWTFWVGIIPVWATLRLSILGRVTVDIAGRASVVAWAKAFAYYKVGVEYNKGEGWSTIWEQDSGSAFNVIPTWDVDFTFTPSASAELALLVYDVAGPLIECELYAPFSMHFGDPNIVAFQLKLRINIGVTFKGWLKDLLGLRTYRTPVADWLLKEYLEP
jgi:hypothetical protein